MDSNFLGITEALRGPTCACINTGEQPMAELLPKARLLLIPPPTGAYNPRRECWHAQSSSLFTAREIEAVLAFVHAGVFGSFLGGYHVLRELLAGELADRVQVVGIATDDPTQPFTHPKVRLWQYPHSRDDELLIPRFTQAHGLPVYTGRVKTPEFERMFVEEWAPDLCLMATFGQKIPPRIFSFPELGFYNFHHSGDTGPSYPGPDPIAAMVRDGRKQLVLTIPKVTDVIDGGEFVAHSHRVAIHSDSGGALRRPTARAGLRGLK